MGPGTTRSSTQTSTDEKKTTDVLHDRRKLHRQWFILLWSSQTLNLRWKTNVSLLLRAKDGRSDRTKD